MAETVVAGSHEFIGSDASKLRASISDASREPQHANVAIALRGDSASIRASSPQRDAQLYFAIVENDVTTNVARGENGGRTLVNDAIVRRFTRLGSVIDQDVPLKLDPRWKRANLFIVAFVQDPKTMHILGAASAR